MQLTHEKSSGVVEIQRAGSRRVNPHLVLDAGAGYAVARAHAAVGVELELGHQEHTEPLDTRRRIRRARKHHVYDVFREIVLTGRDEAFGAIQNVAAIVPGRSPGADQTQIGAALGLRQTHGAAPTSFHQRRQPDLLQRLAAVAADELVCPVTQTGIHGEGQIGGAEHLGDQGIHGRRQSLTAIVDVGRNAGPTGGGELPVSFLEAVGRAHHTVLQPAPLLVAAAVQRLQDRLAEPAGFVEHRVQHIGREILVARQALQLLVGKQLVQHEFHVLEGCVVNRHMDLTAPVGASPLRG